MAQIARLSRRNYAALYFVIPVTELGVRTMALVKCMDCGKKHGSRAPAGVLLEDWRCEKCGGALGMYVSCEACGWVEEDVPTARIRRPVRHLVRLKATECPQGHP